MIENTTQKEKLQNGMTRRLNMDKEKMDLINRAIKNLIQEKRNNQSATKDEDDDDQLLLSKLLSQLESLESNDNDTQAITYSQLHNGDSKTQIPANELANRDEIVKELKNVKRQNKVTHLLLSTMLFLTVVWQVSEVSIILRTKSVLSNPFKWLRNMLVGSTPTIHRKGDEERSITLPLPHVDLPLLS